MDPFTLTLAALAAVYAKTANDSRKAWAEDAANKAETDRLLAEAKRAHNDFCDSHGRPDLKINDYR